MFIGIPRSPGILEFGSFKTLFVDGSHCKDVTYEGAIILGTVKTCLAHSLSVILAFVPSENANHMSWVVQMIIINTGVDLSDHKCDIMSLSWARVERILQEMEKVSEKNEKLKHYTFNTYLES